MSRAATYRVRDIATGCVLADNLRPAHTHWSRLKGLLGSDSLPDGEGLWLKPCRQVHMFWMRYPIDVAFLDEDLRIVQTVSALAPGKVSPRVARATSALELPAGRLATLGVASGAQLSIEPDPRSSVVGGSGRARAKLSPAVRAAVWVVGFLVITALGVSLAARVISPDAVCPSYICF